MSKGPKGFSVITPIKENPRRGSQTNLIEDPSAITLNQVEQNKADGQEDIDTKELGNMTLGNDNNLFKQQEGHDSSTKLTANQHLSSDIKDKKIEVSLQIGNNKTHQAQVVKQKAPIKGTSEVKIKLKSSDVTLNKNKNESSTSNSTIVVKKDNNQRQSTDSELKDYPKEPTIL